MQSREQIRSLEQIYVFTSLNKRKTDQILLSS